MAKNSGDGGPPDATDRRGSSPAARSTAFILLMSTLVIGWLWIGQRSVVNRPPTRPALFVLRACDASSAGGSNSGGLHSRNNQSYSSTGGLGQDSTKIHAAMLTSSMGSGGGGAGSSSSSSGGGGGGGSSMGSGSPIAAPPDMVPGNWEIVVPKLPIESNKTTFPDIAARVVELERNGKGRKVISMSLYGADPRYTMGALENALLVKRIWKGWTLRMYIGNGVPSDILAALAALGVDMVHVTSNQKGIAGMYWRFFAIEDRTATRVLVRDCDARLSRRDYAATQEWVESGHFFHTLHDHKSHRQAILGGMWGTVVGFINPAVFQRWREHDGADSPAYLKGSDQVWLGGNIWPHVRLYSLVHASWWCTLFKAAEWRPFPTQREGPSDIVGNVYRPPHFTGYKIQVECDVECRRNVNWTMC